MKIYEKTRPRSASLTCKAFKMPTLPKKKDIMPGIKLHVVANRIGLPHGNIITAAVVIDRDGATKMTDVNLDSLSYVN